MIEPPYPVQLPENLVLSLLADEYTKVSQNGMPEHLENDAIKTVGPSHGGAGKPLGSYSHQETYPPSHIDDPICALDEYPSF